MRLTALLVASFIVVAAGAAAAQDRNRPIDAFFGTFSGGAIAENEDSIYFAVTARDTDVTIRPEGKGFSVNWTSVIRRGGDPKKPDVRRKSTTKAFAPTGTAGLYRAAGKLADPLEGDELSWARIKGSTLTVYLMVIDSAGAYQLQRYDRTLSPTGMQLTFTRVKDGERVRTVKGRLVKTGK